MATDLSCESDSNERTSARAGPAKLGNRGVRRLGNLSRVARASQGCL